MHERHGVLLQPLCVRGGGYIRDVGGRRREDSAAVFAKPRGFLWVRQRVLRRRGGRAMGWRCSLLFTNVIMLRVDGDYDICGWWSLRYGWRRLLVLHDDR